MSWFGNIKCRTRVYLWQCDECLKFISSTKWRKQLDLKFPSLFMFSPIFNSLPFTEIWALFKRMDSNLSQFGKRFSASAFFTISFSFISYLWFLLFNFFFYTLIFCVLAFHRSGKVRYKRKVIWSILRLKSLFDCAFGSSSTELVFWLHYVGSITPEAQKVWTFRMATSNAQKFSGRSA